MENLLAPDQISDVRFTVQPVRVPLAHRHYVIEGRELIKREGEPKYYEMELVTAIDVEGQDRVHNPDHAEFIDKMDPNGATAERSMRFQHQKAVRLASAFGNLRRGHDLHCHDFLASVEHWSPHFALMDASEDILLDASQIEPGTPYRVTTSTTNGNNRPNVFYSHSGIGASNGQMLGVLGVGSALTFMDGDDAIELYGYNGVPGIVKAYGFVSRNRS